MKKNDKKVLNILTSCGLIFLIFVCINSFLQPSQNSNFTFLVISTILQILLGVIIAVYSVKYTKTAYHFFVGFILSAWGLLLFFMGIFTDFTILQMWPIFGVVTGLVVFVTGFYKYRTIKIGYFFPSLVMVILCLFYSLFSFNIIKISFKKFVAIIGPLFIALLVLILVLYFFMQQKNKQLIIKDEEDAFSEEEVISNITE